MSPSKRQSVGWASPLSRITYTSEYFQRLYGLAEELIKRDKAYVCHCSDTETKLQRGSEDGSSPRYRCEHAKQDVETNLAKSRAMRDGGYKPGTAWLRMKQDIENLNPQMWDIAAYLSNPREADAAL